MPISNKAEGERFMPVNYLIAVTVPKGTHPVVDQLVERLTLLLSNNGRPMMPEEEGYRGNILLGKTEVELAILTNTFKGDVVVSVESLGRIRQLYSHQGSRVMISPGLPHHRDEVIESNIRLITGSIRKYVARDVRMKAIQCQQVSLTVPA